MLEKENFFRLIDEALQRMMNGQIVVNLSGGQITSMELIGKKSIVIRGKVTLGRKIAEHALSDR